MFQTKLLKTTIAATSKIIPFVAATTLFFTLFLTSSAQAGIISSNFNWWSGDFSQTTIDGIEVTLKTENVERYENTSIRDLPLPKAGKFTFNFNQKIESFTVKISRVHPSESLTSFSIPPTNTTGDLFIDSGKITSKKGGDFGTGAINWSGLNTKTISFTTAPVGGAMAFDSFQATTRTKPTCENTAPNNLVVNGSFETPTVPNEGYLFVSSYSTYPTLVPPVQGIENWDLVAGSGILFYNFSPYGYYTVDNSAQFVDLDSGSTTNKISQKISTQSGESYKLTFGFTGSGKLNVNWGDELVEAIDQVDSNDTWEEKTYNLEAKSTETVLSFDNLNETPDGSGIRLDGVSVNLCQ